VGERGRAKGGEGLRLGKGLKVWDKGVGLEVGKRVKVWEKWKS
jgi:hypothetical protein